MLVHFTHALRLSACLPLLFAFRLCSGGAPPEPAPPVVRAAPLPDRDGDGLSDAEDGCPEAPEDKDGHQDDDGCPDLDNDQDGFQDGPVASGGDACPGAPGVALYQGCPVPDRDGDGVVDAFDPCPDEVGPLERGGCAAATPIELSPTRVRWEGKIRFSIAKATIRRESYALLKALAAALKAHPHMAVEIRNHRDAYQRDVYGMRLTDKRAQAVRAFLIEHGVSADRLIARGYGEEQPIDTNKTPEGRENNRRTEVFVREHRRAGFAPVEVYRRSDSDLIAGPGDADGDGVADRADACPNEAGVWAKLGCR